MRARICFPFGGAFPKLETYRWTGYDHVAFLMLHAKEADQLKHVLVVSSPDVFCDNCGWSEIQPCLGTHFMSGLWGNHDRRIRLELGN